MEPSPLGHLHCNLKGDEFRPFLPTHKGVSPLAEVSSVSSP